jgi:hypothetical protein
VTRRIIDGVVCDTEAAERFAEWEVDGKLVEVHI